MQAEKMRLISVEEIEEMTKNNKNNKDVSHVYFPKV